MDLALAGALSGAGNAGTQALQQVGQFAGQSFIEQERKKWEDARLQLQEDYATKRQQAEFAHATGLLAQREAGQESRLTRKLASDEANTGMQITSAESQKELDRKSAEGIHAADQESKEKLANAEVAMKSKYYDALSHYYSLGGRSAGKTGSGEAPVDKKQKEYLESVTKPLIDNLSKQLELASPDEREAIQERLDQVIAEARRVANVGAPPTRKPIVDPDDIKDPFAKPKVTGGR